MNNLTDQQVTTLLTLSETYEAITAVTIYNTDTYSSVDIHTKSDLTADNWDAVDVAVKGIFPGSKYDSKKPFQLDGRIITSYGVIDNSKLRVTIYTEKKLPAPTESQNEILHPEYISEVWDLEDVLRREA